MKRINNLYRLLSGAKQLKPKVENWSSGLQQGKTIISRHFGNFCMTLLIILISMVSGYVLRVHHEAKIHKSYQSQAEKDIATLEEEFYSASEKPHNFFIFNGMFEVFPLKASKRMFSFRKVEDADSRLILQASLTNHNAKVRITEGSTH